MLTNLLIKVSIKNYNDISDIKVRNSYGILGGLVGIFLNLLLSLTKLIIGFIVSSISITADGFNNLTDALSSVITIIGFKLASKPADKEHPFGHGRVEYISALIVSFIVLLVGFQFVQSSIDKIRNPKALNFETIPFILLILSIIIKLWISRFNKFVGTKINSSALKAASLDALGDVFTTSCVAIGFLASKFTKLPIDGYLGLFVALFIMYSGYTLIKDTISPLLGEAPDPQLVTDLKNMISSYDNIVGIHDLIIHNYGPGRRMASVHAEIPSDISFVEIHETIDAAEREISEKLNLHLVIHMDPICTISEENIQTYNEINEIVQAHPNVISFHDFRVVGEGNIKSIIFDAVVDFKIGDKNITSEKIKKQLADNIYEKHPNYNCIITIDTSFL